MGYYIGLELAQESIKLINVKEKRGHYQLESKLSIDLSKPLCLNTNTEDREQFKRQLEQVLCNKKGVKGNKLGILLPSRAVIRRSIKVPYFIVPQIKSYMETNKTQFLPPAVQSFTMDYEECSLQPNKDYKNYQIRGIEDTLLIPFTMWLEDLDFHTIAITTLGDTLPYAITELKREGAYCVLCNIGQEWHVIFYEGNQCVYEHTIKETFNAQTSKAWEIYKAIQFTHPYENSEEIPTIIYLYEDDLSKGVIEEISDLLGQQIEYIVSSSALNYIGLMGLIYQISKGGKRHKSYTYSLQKVLCETEK